MKTELQSLQLNESGASRMFGVVKKNHDYIVPTMSSIDWEEKIAVEGTNGFQQQN